MNFEEYSALAYRYFGKFVESLEPMVKWLRRDLQWANIKVTSTAYFSAALLTSLLAFLIFLIPAWIVIILRGISPIRLLLAIILSLTLALLVAGVFLVVPRLLAEERKRSIEASLPYAVNHMATIAISGVPPLAIFRSLARFERYGEISKEADMIVRDSENFGYDITEAIKRRAERTPSEEFKKILTGVASTITTGGDLAAFLNETASEITTKYRAMWKDIIERLGMYSEAYVTIFVAGPIFFIVMGTMMGVVGGGPISPIELMKVFVYLIIPALNIIYLLFVEATIPKME